MPGPDTIEREVILPVEPEEAWRALTEPEELEAWFADEVPELDARPGGRAAFRWDGDGEREAVVEEADEPRRLVFRWDGGDAAPGQAGPRTRVAFELEEVDGGTRLVVRESGFEAGSLLDAPAWLPRLQARCAGAPVAA